ncbi:poly(A) polymerase [Alkalispirochaeta americana]|uniref:Poly(A) polymerase n=1 Tax=Alkalispirochaeta americana TaxID=159291 RepID=A0A1N6S2P1_9SPIO|nr:HD domain-containing protein [Alkalispirochaeta americana]SIQ35339.1 poly(A) polymerase [Alkalispirochaeta americana]
MVLKPLEEEPREYRYLGISALEGLWGFPAATLATLETEATLPELARIFPEITFPGLPFWDVLVRHEGRELLIRSADSDGSHHAPRHPLFHFAWEPGTRRFSDPAGLYPLLKEARRRSLPEPLPLDDLEDPLEAALLCARFPFAPARSPEPWQEDPSLPAAFHRLIISQIITGPRAWAGLEILRRSGYLAAVLPELDQMNRTEHSKEGHPEGNVWRHTVETFRYQKNPDLLVSLALLFHDSGKPLARPREGRRFDGHAELGARVAASALKRLGFSSGLIDQATWLIRYHMIPGALESLPDHRRDPLMASPLFPQLLELYRCDLSSSFRGPEGYYQACTRYRRFLKKNRHRKTSAVPGGGRP